MGTTHDKKDGFVFQRCLGQSGCSTVGLLLLLGTWGLVLARRPGHWQGSSNQCADNCRELIHGLASVFSETRVIKACKVVFLDAAPVYPHVAPAGVASMNVLVSAGGVLDFQEHQHWCNSEDPVAMHIANRWASGLCHVSAQDSWSWQLPVVDFLGIAFQKKDLCSHTHIHIHTMMMDSDVGGGDEWWLGRCTGTVMFGKHNVIDASCCWWFVGGP